MELSIGTIENYYGGLVVKKEDDKYFWGIENYNPTKWEEIPYNLYETLLFFEIERNNKKPL